MASQNSSSNGTFNHGDPSLVCKPAAWHDVLLFFGLNYVAHVATLKTVPGESTLESLIDTLVALLTPAASVLKASAAIRRMAIRNGGSPLRAAARAGALVTVARNHKWRPRAGDRVTGLKFSTRKDEATTLARYAENIAKISDSP